MSRSRSPAGSGRRSGSRRRSRSRRRERASSPALVETNASSASRAGRARRRRTASKDATDSWLTELFPGEFAETGARVVVRTERLVVGVARVGRDLFGDRAAARRRPPPGVDPRAATTRSTSQCRRTRARRCRRAAGRAGGRPGCRRTCGTRGSGRGLETSASISGFSRCSCSTIEPIGSSTSGIQMSSVTATEVFPISAESARLRRVNLLAALAAEPAKAALFLDVDGVLAPIVERPEDARVPDRDAVRSSSGSQARTASSPA